MAAIQNGGGWITLPIVAGAGSASTVTIPSMGMSLAGCVQVWEGHSGEWSIHATDNVSEEELEIRANPGTGVHFAHTFGLRAQLEVDVQWSEARDTTLWLWVGLDRVRDDTDDPCTPKG